MSNRDDRTKTSIRNRHDPLSWMTEQDRAEKLATLRAMASDTRLPGEIASTYKTTPAVIVRLQQRLRRRNNK
jgi:hypothetical protein